MLKMRYKSDSYKITINRLKKIKNLLSHKGNQESLNYCKLLHTPKRLRGRGGGGAFTHLCSGTRWPQNARIHIQHGGLNLNCL